MIMLFLKIPIANPEGRPKGYAPSPNLKVFKIRNLYYKEFELLNLSVITMTQLLAKELIYKQYQLW